MYVKRIEINGFKSFANSTVLDFGAPIAGRNSITAIVGPNGSGKSNIADAIRWVLGEQSMKHLRGKKSEDIIFAGSEGKGKMSLASVSFILDNTDKRAPVDYDELVITRKLYRSGESEYLINGSTVRLFDLQLLLAQAQFGHGSYSVIGQGMIDRLLLQSPMERKSFFDEAVGIKEFQIKRHHAMLKLVRTRENMAQAETVLQEVEPRLKSLKRQVTKLQQRQEVEQEVRELQEKYYATVFIDLAQHIGQIQTELDGINHAHRTIEDSLFQIQTELATLAQEKSRQEIFQQLQSEYQQLQQKKHSLERDRAILAGKLQTEFSKAGQQQIAWLHEKISTLSEQKNGLEKEIQSEQMTYGSYSESLDVIRRDIDTIERKKIQLQQEKLDIEKIIHDLRQGRYESGVEGLKAVEAILRERHSFGGQVHGIVAQLAHVEEKYRVALEVAAQSHLASLITDNEQVAQKCIEFLKRQQLGYATFLPLTTIRPRLVSQDILDLSHRSGVHGLAIDLVSFDKEYSNIFSYVFGSTLVVDSIDTMRDVGIGRVRMVTLEGDVAETSGSLKGGFRRRLNRGLTFSGKQGDYFEQNKIEIYEKDKVGKERLAEELEQTLNKRRQQVVEAQTHVQVVAQKIELLETQQRDIVKQLAGLEQELTLTTLSPDQYSAMMGTLEDQKTQVDADVVSIDNELGTLNNKMAQFNEQEEEKRKRVFLLQDEMQQKQSELNTVVQKKNSLQIEITKLQTHKEDLEEEAYRELKEHVTIIVEKGVELLTHGIEQVKEEIEKLKYKLSLIGGIDDEVMIEYETTRQRHEELSTQLTDLREGSDDLEELIAELDDVMKQKHEKVFKKIKKEFERYFSLLFDGGKAELVEVYGDEPDQEMKEREELAQEGVEILEEIGEEQVEKKKKKVLLGIEVFACPPGKKIKDIAALSGGERTLTSMALLCAILHVNPPPFVLLDEIEAALDESNTLRFTKILTELSEQSQFIIITHNRVTMHAANILYGVTMGNDGMSKLLSVKLDEAEKAVQE